MDDMKNGKKSSTPTSAAANKRYSIDNYCSNWLSNACKQPTPILTPAPQQQHDQLDTNAAHEKNHSLNATNDKAANGHEHQLRLNKLQHRRSLSENIIPFPPHTTPSDKARCHLINRRNSQLNASSGKKNRFFPCFCK